MVPETRVSGKTRMEPLPETASRHRALASFCRATLFWAGSSVSQSPHVQEGFSPCPAYMNERSMPQGTHLTEQPLMHLGRTL
jgi:hypothetical protein